MTGLTQKALDGFVDYHGLSIEAEKNIYLIYDNRNLHGRCVLKKTHALLETMGELVDKGFIIFTEPKEDRIEIQLLLQTKISYELRYNAKEKIQ